MSTTQPWHKVQLVLQADVPMTPLSVAAGLESGNWKNGIRF
jgi:hypothetical protein